MKSLLAVLFAVCCVSMVRAAEPAPVVVPNPLDQIPFPPHDRSRPQPEKVDPRPESELLASAKAPAGAVVLFDGTNTDAWESTNGGAVKWVVVDKALVVVPKTGNIHTKESFGSCRLHMEYCSPSPALGQDQNAGNSGAIFMGRYEVQVLDCYTNRTYADGTVGAVYGQNPPRVNACGPPGTWQYYDIDFTAPKFDDAGKLVSPAVISAVLNGHEVQKDYTLVGPTVWKVRPPYTSHKPKLPLILQDHGQPVKFRNVWLVPKP
jgi:hypothetical protein